MKRVAVTIVVLCGLVLFGLGAFVAGVYTARMTDVGSGTFEASGVDVRPGTLNVEVLERLVVAERQQVGLEALAHSDVLETSACAKLDDMVAKNYWAHTAPDGTEPWHYFGLAGYDYRNAGENLAYGQTDEASTIAQWMKSPKHKENILGQFTEQGICSKTVKFQGAYVNLTVHHFGTPY